MFRFDQVNQIFRTAIGRQQNWIVGLAFMATLLASSFPNNPFSTAHLAAQTTEAQSTQSVSESATTETAASPTDEETKALHDKLAKYLSGTKWTGQFTMKGKKETRTEEYEILSASKGDVGDYWNLIARIKYGDHDATLPLPPIEIKFAGGTPVITVDKASFPGFGKFDARVLIRKGQYAGTWAHIGPNGEGVGGHMFGTIEKMDPEEVKKKVDAVDGSADKSK